jgi:general stress protein 26
MTAFVAALFLLTWPGQAAPSRDAALAASRTIIAKAEFATLTSLHADGSPDARIIDPFPVEPDFTIWFATNAASRKVGEMRRDPRVSLLYFDKPSSGYVMLKGRVTLVSDPKEKAARWKGAWTGMYQDENRGDDYLLVKFVPESLEVVSVALGMINDSATWKPVTITFPKSR